MKLLLALLVWIAAGFCFVEAWKGQKRANAQAQARLHPRPAGEAIICELPGPERRLVLDAAETQRWLEGRDAGVKVLDSDPPGNVYGRRFEWRGEVFPAGECKDDWVAQVALPGEKALMIGGYGDRHQWRINATVLYKEHGSPHSEYHGWILIESPVGLRRPTFVFHREQQVPDEIGILIPDLEKIDPEASLYYPESACDVRVDGRPQPGKGVRYGGAGRSGCCGWCRSVSMTDWWSCRWR